MCVYVTGRFKFFEFLSDPDQGIKESKIPFLGPRFDPLEPQTSPIKIEIDRGGTPCYLSKKHQSNFVMFITPFRGSHILNKATFSLQHPSLRGSG